MLSRDELKNLHGKQYVDAERVELDVVRLDVARYDVVTQLLDESHISISEDGIKLFPIVTRFAWPSELDLMARLAGLRLRERWSDWNRSPFPTPRGGHISVWERADEPT